MRKFAAFLLVLSLFVAALPASAQEGIVDCGVEENVTLTVFVGSVGQDRPMMERALDLWQSYCPNYSFNLVDQPESTTELLALILQLFEARSPDIDVFSVDVIFPGTLAPHLLDLSPYISEEELAAHFPGIVNACTTAAGELICIPWFTDAGMLYYRTDLLEKYGYDAPPATWDELTEMAQVIQDGERAEGNSEFWGFVWQGNAYEGLTCDALEWQYSEDGSLIVAPDGEIQVNTEGAIRAFERAASWVGTISPPGVTTYQEEDARAVWHAGNAAFMRNWPYAYSLSQGEDSAVKDIFGVSALPAGEFGSAATLGGWNVAVSRYSANPDAAATLAAFIAGAEVQKIRAIEGSYQPTIMALYEDEDVLASSPIFGELYDVLINAVARPSLGTGAQYNEVSTLYFTAVHNILTGQEDADVALDLLELDLIALLGG